MSVSSISRIINQSIDVIDGDTKTTLRTRIVKGQAMFEYIAILGVVLALLLPAIYLFYTRSQTTTDQVSIERLTQMGNSIVDSAAYVFPFGSGSKTTIDFTMPIGVSNITVNGDPALSTGNILVINLNIRGVNNSMVFFSKYPLVIGNCSKSMPLPASFISNPGDKTFQIISCGANVSIYQKQ